MVPVSLALCGQVFGYFDSKSVYQHATQTERRTRHQRESNATHSKYFWRKIFSIGITYVYIFCMARGSTKQRQQQQPMMTTLVDFCEMHRLTHSLTHTYARARGEYTQSAALKKKNKKKRENNYVLAYRTKRG